MGLAIMMMIVAGGFWPLMGVSCFLPSTTLPRLRRHCILGDGRRPGQERNDRRLYFRLVCCLNHCFFRYFRPLMGRIDLDGLGLLESADLSADPHGYVD